MKKKLKQYQLAPVSDPTKYPRYRHVTSLKLNCASSKQFSRFSQLNDVLRVTTD